MENLFESKWPAIIMVSLVALSFYTLKKSWKEQTVESPLTEDLSYEMPRPKNFGSDYDISQRQVVWEEHHAEAAKKQGVTGGKAPVTTAAANAKKKADEKNKKKSKKTAQNKNKKAGELNVRLADADGASPMSGFSDGTDIQNVNGQIAELPPPTTTSEPAKTTPTVVDEVKLTATQWRALLMAEPTQKNASNFYQAYRKKEIDAASFYQISGELLSSNEGDQQQIALYLLQADPSLGSFVVLTAHYTEKTPEALRAKIYEVLKQYADPARFGVLTQALGSTDTNTQKMAAQIVSVAVASHRTAGQSGGDTEPTPGSGRDGRSPGSTPVGSTADLKAFIPALQLLIKSSDTTLASQAQALLDSIQALNQA
ncbi:MAG: hypothetical protein COT73_00120 [Bdellovibrio sp. CG10_big_fil_rev_8_21_14_0_10_47_8]|nr:MAG: hypothetical protein COT73_00120 [Bdellovibrio sp. CG10_big_fil_rev_8_21_14_0_10_47_8]